MRKALHDMLRGLVVCVAMWGIGAVHAQTPQTCFCEHSGDQGASSKQILFIGNSFLHGHSSNVVSYNAANVTDLNGSGMGGVPGIFKQLTVEAGLNYDVHLELVSAKSLMWHYDNKRSIIGSKKWDVVVMNEYSLLDQSAPGNPAKLIQSSQLLEQFIHGAGNPNGQPTTQVLLLETWPRADQVYPSTGHWYGRTVEDMGADLHAAYQLAATQDPLIHGVVPVGHAFLRGIAAGVIDRNPYDGIDAGKHNMWGSDNFHLSTWGSYVEALVLLGRLTGVDPRTLGASSTAARGLQLTSAQAVAAQQLAYDQLTFGARH